MNLQRMCNITEAKVNIFGKITLLITLVFISSSIGKTAYIQFRQFCLPVKTSCPPAVNFY